jgi:excisionase family DNA binding protein
VLTVQEAAALVGRDAETVRRWVREGRISSRRDGPRILLYPDEVALQVAEPTLPLPAAWAAGQPDWVALVRRSRGGAR